MKLHSIILILLFSGLTVFAQDPSAPKVTVYKPFKPTQTVDPAKVVQESWCAKWNIYMLARGTFDLSLEKMLSEKFSVEGGLGITYRDWVYELFHDDEFLGGFDASEVDTKFGPFASISCRFYPKEGNLEGLYISPLIRYRKYNISTIPAQFSGETAIDVGYKMTDYAFLLGYQSENWFSDFFTEVYIGAGISKQSFRSFETINAAGDEGWVDKNKQTPIILFGGTVSVPF